MADTHIDISKVMSCAQKTWRFIENRKLYNIATLLLVLATFLLVLVTFGYLRETKKQRLLLEKKVAVETQPKVFIKAVDTNLEPDYMNNRLIIHTNVVLSNCGKMEARNVCLSYVIFQGTQVEKDKYLGPYPYMFPDQIFVASIEKLNITLPVEDMENVKKAFDEQAKKAVIRAKLPKRLLLKIELVYEDAERQLAPPVSYAYRYDLLANAWIYTREKDVQ